MRGWKVISADLLSTPSLFREPPAEFRPKVRWWWPLGKVVEGEQLRRDMRAIANAGFGGVSIWRLGPAADFSTPEWRRYYEQALTAGRDHGLRVDFQDAPMASPAVSGPNKHLSAQELAYGKVELSGPTTFEGLVPTPQGVPDSVTLVSVGAFKLAGAGDSSRPVMLEPGATIDLTLQVADNRLQWGVPAGDWVLFGFWQRPTGQRVPRTGLSLLQPSAKQHEEVVPHDATLVVDHFSRQATEAALRHLDEVMDGIPADLFAAAAGQISEDSLELTAELLWTNDFLPEFEERRGYSLTPFLPVLFVEAQHDIFHQLGFDTPPDFDLPGGIGERVRHDYNETLTDLHIDNYLVPISRWAEQRGLRYANQPVYGTTMDATRSATAVPVVETETFEAGDPLPPARDGETPADRERMARYAADFYRVVASGAHLSGASEVSLEFGSYTGRNFVFNPIDYKRLIDRAYTGGVTQAILHGVPYDKPGAVWPGWAPYADAPVLISELWNERFPQWQDWPALNSYMSRANVVLQQGSPRIDLVVFRDAPTAEVVTPLDSFYRTAPPAMREMLPLLGMALPPGGQESLPVEGPIFDAEGLANAGYTYGFVDPVTLATRATFTTPDGLFPDGPRYRALIVDEQQAMSGAAADRIELLAREGLPVVFVGDVPMRGTSAKDPVAEDAQVRRAVTAALELDNVRQVATTDDLHDALVGLGVEPDVRYGDAVAVRPVHRHASGVDHWYLFNDGDHAVETVASFRTTGRPVSLDLWNGTITPIARYRRHDDRVDVPLNLASYETHMIAFGGDEPINRRHIVATNASDAAYDGDRLVLRDTRPGACSVELSDGTTLEVDIPILPTPIRVDRWHLHVDEVTPTSTIAHDVALSVLVDWRTIDELALASGTGTYTAQASVPQDWLAPDRGVYLDVGHAEGSLKVTVNGQLATNQSTPGGRWPIGRFLQPGNNDIEVVVRTTLNNGLVALGQSGEPQYATYAGRTETRPYGLLGPVQLIPYAEVALEP